MNQAVNDVIALFQHTAQLLELQKGRQDLDDAVELLAGWIRSSAHELTEDDLVALTLVGGIIYRQGLVRRTLE